MKVKGAGRIGKKDTLINQYVWRRGGEKEYIEDLMWTGRRG